MNAKETVMSLWVGEAKHINSFASPPGGYSREFLMGVCRPVLQILTLTFRQKKFIFHTRFQTWRWSQKATLHVCIKQKLCYHC